MVEGVAGSADISGEDHTLPIGAKLRAATPGGRGAVNGLVLGSVVVPEAGRLAGTAALAGAPTSKGCVWAGGLAGTVSHPCLSVAAGSALAPFSRLGTRRS